MSCHSSPQYGSAKLVDRITLLLRSPPITEASSLLRAAPPLALASVFFLVVSATCHFPFHPDAKFSRSIPKPVSSSCRRYTGCRRDRKQVPSRLIPELTHDPGFDSAIVPIHLSSAQNGQEIVKLCDLTEAKLRDNDQFAQLHSGGDDLLSKPGQVVLVRAADFLDQPMQAQAFEQARDLGAGFAG